MSYATLILGESGTGKTCSLRNLDPSKTFLIQSMRKPLPFKAKGWGRVPEGNIFANSDVSKVVEAMTKAPHEIIVVDDWQYFLAQMYMNARNVKGFDKFTEIGGAGYDILKTAINLPTHKRVYIMAHTMTDDFGNVKIKTLGKLLDDKIVPEGMFTTVLRTHVENGKYMFSTQNSGHDTVKSPMGMFAEKFIENDLAEVDKVICDYYEINTTNKETN